MTALIAAVRAIHFASLMTIFGGMGYAALLRRQGVCELPGKAGHRLFMVAAMLALASGIAWFCLVAGEMSGCWQGSVDPMVLQLTSETRFGRIFEARLIGLAVLCLMCGVTKTPKLVVSILAGVLLASLAPISHAAASGGEIAIRGASNDAVHLLAAGSWLGGLAVLVLLIPRYRTDAIVLLGALRIFSVWGSVIVALLVITGVINAVSVLPFSSMSLRNPYFELLLIKVGLAAAMMGLAALNRWRFGPALPSGGDRAVGNLARSVALELVLAFVVVAIVGYLGTMAPTDHHMM